MIPQDSPPARVPTAEELAQLDEILSELRKLSRALPFEAWYRIGEIVRLSCNLHNINGLPPSLLIRAVGLNLHSLDRLCSRIIDPNR